MRKKKLLHQALGLALNERLRKLRPSRVEYGLNDLALDFEVTNSNGSCRLVTEEEFAKHKGVRTIGLFGTASLVAALILSMKMYPDAGIWMKKDPKRRRFSH